MNSPFAVPIVLFIVIGLSIVLKGPLGHAIAERIRGHAADDPRLREDMDALRLEVDELRQQLGEAQERIDFAERLLAAQREPERLGKQE